MVMRLWKKAVKMSLRERKTFTVFVLMYTVLIFLTSFSLEMAISAEIQTRGLGNTMFLVALIASIFLTLLYAWLIVRRNRIILATLKCIGWSSGNVTSLILGQIFFTTLTGLLLTVETLFHYMAIVGYIQAASVPTALVVDLPIITLMPVVATVGIFVAVQLVGYFGARGRITKVRPMLALKRVGE